MWSARRLMMVLAIIGIILGLFVWLARPSVYQATARVFVERPPVSGTVNPFQSGGITSAGPSAQEAVIKSYGVLTAALKEPGVGDGPVLGKISDPVAYLRKKLSIRVDEDKETYTLRFNSTDAHEAVDVINAVVKHYVATQNRRANLSFDSISPHPTHTTSPLTPTTLTSEQARDNTNANTLALTPTVESAFAVRVGSREMMSRLAEQHLTRLNEEIIDAQLKFEATESRLRLANEAAMDINHLMQLALESKDDIRIDQSSIDHIRRLQEKLDDAQTKLSNISERYGQQHRVYRQYELDVTTQKEQLADAKAYAATNLLSMFNKAHQQSEKQLAQLNQRIAMVRESARQIEQLAIEILDPAITPQSPIAPKLPIHLAVGAIMGMMIGALLGLIGEINRVAELSKHYDMPVAPGGYLALPNMHDADPTRTGWDRPNQMALAPPMLGSIPRIAATHRLLSPGYDRAADSVHQIRAVLQAMARKDNLKSVSFISPRRGTGRTSVTIGVASSLAMSDTRVLAVDGDLSGRITRRQQAAARTRSQRRHAPNHTLVDVADEFGHFKPTENSHSHDEINHQHDDPIRRAIDNDLKKHGQSNDEKNGNGTNTNGNGNANSNNNPVVPGIGGFLDGLPLHECLKTATADRLAFLPASNAEERHVGLMSDRKMLDLIEQARDDFDLILFDSGPVPGTLESLTIASVVDGVVLVLEENHSMADYQRTMQYLRVINANLLGVIINKVGHNVDQDANTPASDKASRATNATRGSRGTNGADTKISTNHDDTLDQNAQRDFAQAGSGLLAMSVFSDAQAGYHEHDWELTSINDTLGTDDVPDLDDIPIAQTNPRKPTDD